MSSKLFVKNVFQERHCIDDINNFIFFLIDERVLQKNSSSKFKKKTQWFFACGVTYLS